MRTMTGSMNPRSEAIHVSPFGFGIGIGQLVNDKYTGAMHLPRRERLAVSADATYLARQ